MIEADVVSAFLLAERGISARYIARVLSRIRGAEITADMVEAAVLGRERDLAAARGR